MHLVSGRTQAPELFFFVSIVECLMVNLRACRLPMLISALFVVGTLAGCDGNDAGETVDEAPAVEFASNPDTLAFYKDETVQLAVDNTDLSGDTILVDWALSGGNAAYGPREDFTIPAQVVGGGTQRSTQEIWIDPEDPHVFDLDNLPPNIDVVDTTATGIFIVERELVASQQFETTYDVVDKTGQVQIRASQAEGTVNTGTITLLGSDNASRTQPRSVVVEMTDARTAGGGDVRIGRRVTDGEGTTIDRGAVTVLFGQADVSATGPVEFSQVLQSSQPFETTFIIENRGTELGSEADIPTTLSNFEISGSDAFSIREYRVLELESDGSFRVISGFQPLGSEVTLKPDQLAQLIVQYDADAPATDLATFTADVDRDHDVKRVAVDFSGITLP